MILNKLKNIFCIVISSYILSTNVLAESHTELLNNGRAIDVIKQLTKDIERYDGKKKLDAIYLLADVCILTDDEVCLKNAFDSNVKLLYDNLKKWEKKNPSEIDSWKSVYDTNQALFAYRVLTSLDESSFDLVLSGEESNFHGHPDSSHSGLRLIVQANIASMKGDKALAEQFMRRARALVLNKDLAGILHQSNLAYLLESSLYYLNDSKDIKRWLTSSLAANLKMKQDIDKYYNPYVYLRIFQAIYSSGLLDKQQENFIINHLHKFYSTIQISDSSRLGRKREEFYAFLAFESFNEKNGLTFNPEEELRKYNAQSFSGVGVKAFLDIESGKTNLQELEVLLKRFNEMYRSRGPSIQAHLDPSLSILNSLIEKAKNNHTEEAKNIEKYISSEIKLLEKMNLRPGDNNPILNKQAFSLISYSIDRLKKIKPDSVEIENAGLMLIQSISSSYSGDEQASYAILETVANDLEKQQVLNFITLKERYGFILSDAYYQSTMLMDKNASTKNLQDRKVLTPDSQAQILDLFVKSSIQLQPLRKRKNLGHVLNIDSLREKIGAKDLAILSALHQDKLMILEVTKDSSNYKVIDISRLDVQYALKILTNPNLENYSEQVIKEASRTFSNLIFTKSTSKSIQNILFINGPSVGNVAYTLLSHPASDDWLINKVKVKAYNSIAQVLSKNKVSKEYPPKYSFVAFANPQLRDGVELASVSNTESLIRGGNGRGVTSLPELPETEVEVTNIAREFKGGKLLFTRREANISNLLKTNLSNVEVLSFSTHGVMSGEVEGALSPSIVLTPNNDDGLASSEILFSMIGSPKVVLLSTCNSKTTSSNLNLSEINSLSSSFSLKGSKAVVSSYWAVNSEATTFLMTETAKFVAKGLSYADALIAAQKKMMSMKKWSHPHMWAAFVITGDYVRNNSYLNSVVEKDLPRMVPGDGFTRDGSLFVAQYDSNSFDEKIYVYNEKNLQFREKISFSNQIVDSIKFDSSFKNVYAGVKHSEKFHIYQIINGVNTKNICSFPLHKDWLVRSFFVKDNFAYSLFTAQNDKFFNFIVTTIDLSNCKQRGRFHSNLISPENLESLLIAPSTSAGHLVLLHTEKLKNEIQYSSGVNELNLPRKCTSKSVTSYSVFGPSSMNDDALDLKNSGVEFNLVLSNFHTYSKNSVHAVQVNPCTFESFARKIDIAWFNDKNLLFDKSGKYLRHKPRGDEAIIGNNFSHILKWHSKDDGDFIYVQGSPNVTSFLFNSTTKQTLPYETKRSLASLEYGQYLYRKSTGMWYLINSIEDCGITTPITFSGNYAIGACFSTDDSTPKNIKSSIYRRSLNH
jgi:CHAT domain-containing protein